MVIGDHQRLSHSCGRGPPGLRVAVEQVGVGLEPLRPLPAAGVEEHRPERFLAREERAAPHPPLARPLLARVDDAVGLVVVLGAAGVDVVLGALVGVEAADVRRVRVADVRVAVGHPLGDEAGDPRPLLDPHRRRRPQVPHLHRLAEHRHRVGGEREETVDRVLDLGVAEHLHQVDGLFQLVVEVVRRERQLGGGQRRRLDRRDVVGVVEDRPVGVRPDLHRPGGLALVAERVHVADDRVGDLGVGLLQHVDRTDVDHLVHGRRERDRRSRHRRDAWTPHAARDRDVLGLDPTLVGDHGPDRAVGDLEVGDLGVGEHREHALVDRLLAHQRAGLQRVDHRHARRVEAAEQHVGVDERDELLDLVRA